MTIIDDMNQLGAQARAAARALALATDAAKSHALTAAAAQLRASVPLILAENAKDMAAASHLSPAMRDRLALDENRIEAMAKGLETVAGLPDPVGRVLSAWDVAHNGLHIEKIAVPLGVIGIIYESRPNVTADAAAIALKAGNAVILRGGSESFHSARAILAAIHAGLAAAGLPATAAQLVPTTDREAVAHMLTMTDSIDVIIPRGGKSLTERVKNEARVPTLLHLDGNCHMFIDASAEADLAERLVLNAKLRRTGICGALESLLIHRECLGVSLRAERGNPAKTTSEDWMASASPRHDKESASTAARLISALLARGCELRGDAAIQALDARVIPATEEDWSTEYLAPILAVKVVDGLEDAIAHINRYGSHHTDAIVTRDTANAERFSREVESAIVLVNASTQFADGGEFGFGAEIGIATGKLHARGPVAAAELTTYQYRVTTANPEGAVRAG